MSGFIATPTMGDIDRLHRRIDSMSLVIEGLEKKISSLGHHGEDEWVDWGRDQ